MPSPFTQADPPPFEERLLACQLPPLITRFRQRGHGGQDDLAWEETAGGRSRRVDGAMMAAPDPLASSSRATSSDVAGASPRKARKLVSSSPQKSPILAATAASFPKETDKVIILSLIYVRLHRSPPLPQRCSTTRNAGSRN